MVKTYEAILVSATIQPGSSGSAVYNLDGEISAVIFAGAGDFGYGFAVPHSYVYKFLALEVPNLQNHVPNNEYKVAAQGSESRSWKKKLEEACKKAKTPGQESICEEFKAKLKDDMVRY